MFNQCESCPEIVSFLSFICQSWASNHNHVNVYVQVDYPFLHPFDATPIENDDSSDNSLGDVLFEQAEQYQWNRSSTIVMRADSGESRM